MWAVVFDSSAYRATGEERFSRLATAERAAGVCPLASAPVAQELLSHVRDAEPQSARRARAAVRRLGRHCAVHHEGGARVTFISHIDAQLYCLLAGREHPNDRELFDQMGALIGDICQAPLEAPLETLDSDITAMALHVSKLEREFIEQLAADAAGGEFDRANRMKRNFRWVERRVHRIRSLYRLEVPHEQMMKHIFNVLKLTELAFLVFDDDLTKVRANPGTHDRRGNSLWDIEIVGATSVNSTIAGRQITVVTEERRLKRAAADAGYGELVMDVAGYEDRLGLDPWASRVPVASV